MSRRGILHRELPGVRQSKRLVRVVGIYRLVRIVGIRPRRRRRRR